MESEADQPKSMSELTQIVQEHARREREARQRAHQEELRQHNERDLVLVGATGTGDVVQINGA